MRLLASSCCFLLAVLLGACNATDAVNVAHQAPASHAGRDVASLRILLGPSVEGIYADTVLQRRVGDSVSYRFQPIAPFDSVFVLLDDREVAASGSVVLQDAHELVVIAQRRTATNATHHDAEAAAIYSSGAAVMSADAADVTELGDHVAGVTPVTVIYTNGILNTYRDSFYGASSLAKALSATRNNAPGWPAIEMEIAATSFLRFGARQPWRVVNQYNPLLKDQWCIGVLRDVLADAGMHLGWPPLDKRVLAAVRAYILRNATAPEVLKCAVVFGGDGARLGLEWMRMTSASPSVAVPQAVAELARFIDAERRSYGGRNVVLVAHSHGNVVVREALRRIDPTGTRRMGVGCVGVVAVAAPFGSLVAFDGANTASHRIIAKGTQPLAHDILYPLGTAYGPYAKSSNRTRAADQALKESRLSLAGVFQMQISLHDFESTYLSADGYRDWVLGAVRQSASALAKECGGRVSGTIRDDRTNEVLAGAVVEVSNATSRLHEARASAQGVYLTQTLPAAPYRIRVSHPGYETKEASIVVQFNALATGAGVGLRRRCGAADPVCDITGEYDVDFTQVLPSGYRGVGRVTAIVRAVRTSVDIITLDIRAAGPRFGRDAVNWPISTHGSFNRRTGRMTWTLVCVLSPEIPLSAQASNSSFRMENTHAENTYSVVMRKRQ